MKIALSITALALSVGAVLGMGQAHADIYEELGHTICVAVDRGMSAGQLIQMLQQAQRNSGDPVVSDAQAMGLLTVTVNGFCPDEMNKLLGSAR